jgi:nitroreductase
VSDETDNQLWRKYVAAAEPAKEPDPLTLAAYADRTLLAKEAAVVEAWLARNPDRIAWILAARNRAVEPAPLDVIRRARDLAPTRAIEVWQPIAGWCAIAAALVMICMTGIEVTFVHHGMSPQMDETTLIDLRANVGVGASDASSLL